MFSLIKELFLPTERNNQIPIILSRPAFWFYWVLGGILFFSLLIFRLSPFAAIIDNYLVFKPSEVIFHINNSRAAAGLPRLAENQKLVLAAEKKASDILTRQYFAHKTPDGQEPWAFVNEAGYQYTAAGENLAIDFTSAKEAHEALMESPSHRANIMNPRYEEVGVSVQAGRFNNNQGIIVVQFFGTPINSSSILASDSTSRNAEDPKTNFLGLGAQGEEVRALQSLLAQDKEIYPQGLITGYFGALTENAVIRFQQKFNVLSFSEKGKIGPETRKKITQVFAGHLATEPTPGVLGAHLEFPRRTSPFIYLIPRFFALLAIGVILTALTFLLSRGPIPSGKFIFNLLLLTVLFGGLLIFPKYSIDSGKLNINSAKIVKVQQP